MSLWLKGACIIHIGNGRVGGFPVSEKPLYNTLSENMVSVMSNKPSLTQGLLDFIGNSPTPFHAVAEMARMLEAGGFKQLRESESWQLESGKSYYLTRNDSSLIAFVYGASDVASTGLRITGAHTDSPCLKVKPAPELKTSGYLRLGVEVYGGALLNPWFDRDLSLAGRINYLDKDDRIASILIDFEKPLAVIPSLAIHLDREANEKRSINKQKDLPPVLMRLSEKEEQFDLADLLLDKVQEQELGAKKILDYELFFYDTQAPALVGLHEEFIASARLDNLLSCYVGIQSLLQAGGESFSLLVCNDHEEVGSASYAGAQGPMLQTLVERAIPDAEIRARALDQSIMVSVDNAHAMHPNFSERHDGNHRPKLNDGPVIKVNANQRYATNSETAARFRHLCGKENIPVQDFVMRSDLACGSTIGPITAAEIGVKTLDVGVPQFAMHSIRETAGVQDVEYLHRALVAFFND
jgi:aspartyl aminopeptidase